MSTVRIAKWGNSLAFRLPSKDAKQWGVADGSHIEIEIANGVLTAREAVKKYTFDELISQCTPENMAPTDDDRQWLNQPPIGKEWGHRYGRFRTNQRQRSKGCATRFGFNTKNVQ